MILPLLSKFFKWFFSEQAKDSDYELPQKYAQVKVKMLSEKVKPLVSRWSVSVQGAIYVICRL